MKTRLILTFLCLMFSFILKAGGLSAWRENTPYGYEMYHDGTSSYTIMMDIGSGVSFKKFYFYKGHTIAQSDDVFYIIDEINGKVQEYKDKNQWEKALEEKNLVPFIKREYDHNYSSAFGSGVIFLLFFLPFPFLLPLIWVICLISLLFPTRRYIGFRKHFSWSYPAGVIFILLWDSTPQSISAVGFVIFIFILIAIIYAIVFRKKIAQWF